MRNFFQLCSIATLKIILVCIDEGLEESKQLGSRTTLHHTYALQWILV